MEDLWRLRSAVIDREELADQATYYRLLREFRAQEQDDHRRRLLYGDDRLPAAPAKPPAGD